MGAKPFDEVQRALDAAGYGSDADVHEYCAKVSALDGDKMLDRANACGGRYSAFVEERGSSGRTEIVIKIGMR